jgi:hypothetical protein
VAVVASALVGLTTGVRLAPTKKMVSGDPISVVSGRGCHIRAPDPVKKV